MKLYFYRVFQCLVLVAAVIYTIFEIRDMIVFDKSSRWAFAVPFALFGMIWLEIYLHNKTKKELPENSFDS